MDFFKDKKIRELTSWLLEVSIYLDNSVDIPLYPETYFLSLEYLKIFHKIFKIKYPHQKIQIKFLQLIGCICFDLSYKIIQGDDDDELNIPFWMDLSANSFSKEDYRLMEFFILDTMEYKLYHYFFEFNKNKYNVFEFLKPNEIGNDVEKWIKKYKSF